MKTEAVSRSRREISGSRTRDWIWTERTAAAMAGTTAPRTETAGTMAGRMETAETKAAQTEADQTARRDR